MAFTPKKLTRWECPTVHQARGYSFTISRFPRCLRNYRGVVMPFHALHHLIGANATRKVMNKLHLAGFLYAEDEGSVYSWQWRFWRGSPHARAWKVIMEEGKGAA